MSSLQQFISASHQPVLVTAPKGIDVTRLVGEQLPGHEVIEPTLATKTSTIPQIGVDTIRQLHASTRSTGAHTIIISQADMMTEQAQNAFLKLLEEPNEQTRLFLTTHHIDKLLPTVRSRLQRYDLPLASQQDSEAILTKHKIFDEQVRRQLLFIASGQTDELTKLAGDEVYRQQVVERVQTARSLITGSHYQRLVGLHTVPLSRIEALQLIEAMQLLLTKAPTEQSLRFIEALERASANIMSNGNPRLQLLAAMLY